MTTIKCICKNCEKVFYTRPSQIKAGRGIYCSQKCLYKWRTKAKVFTVKCETCEKSFKRQQCYIIKNNYCSRKCFGKTISERMKGSKNYFWNGGKSIRAGGYLYLYKPNHPFNKKNYVLESRLIMEKHLGRYLKPEERVHHIDENKLNNILSNLMLFPNQSAHTKHHHPKGLKVSSKSFL